MNKNAEKLVKRLLELDKKISAAESCTGGLFSKLLTDVPGCSGVLDMSFVTYANSAKRTLLGVSEDILNNYGAVSRECAEAMTQGLLRISGADIAVAITGIAGPGGGSPSKPVGTVFIGIGTAAGTRVEKFSFNPALPREQIRSASAKAALAMALNQLD